MTAKRSLRKGLSIG